MAMRRLIIVGASGVAALFLGQLYAETIIPEPALTGHEIVLFLHQLLFVYWLGPDIGVFVWSRKVVNAELTADQRLAAGKIITSIDFIPRVCISLMLTVGGILTESVGLEHPLWQMAGIILLGPVWLSMVLVIYIRRGTALGASVAKLDFWFRWALILAVVASVVYSFSTGRLDEAPWVGGKLLLFAAVVLFGLIMRMRLRPFTDGLARLAVDGPSEQLNGAMATSLSRATPFMIAIWIGLLWAALLGVVKPGSPEPEVAAITVSQALDSPHY
jgi:hypothetical protein